MNFGIIKQVPDALETFIWEVHFIVITLLLDCCSKEGDLVLKKATEYGAVEIWMNERARRACANSCANFVYGFLEVLLYFA